MAGYRLGVDFGTSTTVAVLRWPDGAIKPLLFDGSELLPSAVWRDPAGPLLSGRDALFAGRGAPDRLEPNPKRCVDDGAVLLGADETPVTALIAAVLGRVGAEAARVAGEAPTETVLTCPAGWGGPRRAVLFAAAEAAGLTVVRLVDEPVAAAHHFLRAVGDRLPVGGHLAVYDLGAGTFDASVIRRTASGFEVAAVRGLADAGGLDIDAAVIEHLGGAYARRDPARWRAMLAAETDADRRGLRQLRDDVREAKELLSRAAATTVALPVFSETAPLTREELERLALPMLSRTVEATEAAISAAGVTAERLVGLVLVGGGSRMPLAATLLHQRLGVAPVALERPELAVAEGSLFAAAAPTAAAPAVPAEATSTLDTEPISPPVAGRRGARRWWAAAAVAVLLAAAVPVQDWLDNGQREQGQGSRVTGSASATPPASPSPSVSPVAAGVTLNGHSDLVDSLAFSPDGTRMVSAGLDSTVQLWDVRTGAKVKTLVKGAADTLAFAPDGRSVAGAYVSAAGREIRIWNVATGDVQTTMDDIGHTPVDIQFSPTGRTLASAHLDGKVRLWGPTNGGEYAVLTTARETAWSVSFSPDGRVLATGSSTFTGASTPDLGTVQLWNVATGKQTKRLDGFERAVFSPNGKTLALTTVTNAISLLDVASGKITTLTEQPTLHGGQLAFLSDKLLVSTDFKDAFRLWDLSTGRQVTTFGGEPVDPREGTMAASPRTGAIATTWNSAHVRLWKVTPT
jgi:WD40 repeat protein